MIKTAPSSKAAGLCLPMDVCSPQLAFSFLGGGRNQILHLNFGASAGDSRYPLRLAWCWSRQRCPYKDGIRHRDTCALASGRVYRVTFVEERNGLLVHWSLRTPARAWLSEGTSQEVLSPQAPRDPSSAGDFPPGSPSWSRQDRCCFGMDPHNYLAYSHKSF